MNSVLHVKRDKFLISLMYLFHLHGKDRCFPGAFFVSLGTQYDFLMIFFPRAPLTHASAPLFLISLSKCFALAFLSWEKPGNIFRYHRSSLKERASTTCL